MLLPAAPGDCGYYSSARIHPTNSMVFPVGKNQLTGLLSDKLLVIGACYNISDYKSRFEETDRIYSYLSATIGSTFVARRAGT